MRLIYYFLIGYSIFLFLIILTISWSTIKGAPWAPTYKTKIFDMLKLANVQPGEIVYDLGCGDGRILIIAAKNFGAKAIGIEIDPFRFLWCKFLIWLLGLRKQVQVIYGDFFKTNLSNADIVFCYLQQKTNDRLEEKFSQELKQNTRIISNSFIFSNLPIYNIDEDLEIYAYYIDKK